MSDEKGYLYRVGWLGTVTKPEGQRIPDRPELDSSECLTILGNYTATNAAAAVKLALEDGSNGGVPGGVLQRMVAIPLSRWSEFGGTAEERIEWKVTPLTTGPERIPGQTAFEGPDA